MTFPAQQRKGPGAVLIGSAVRTFTDGDADRGRSAQRTLPLRTVAGLPQFCTSPFSRDESDRRSPLRFSLSRRVACSRRSIPTPRKRLASLEAPACPTRIGEAAFYNGHADRWHPRVIAFAHRWLAPPGALGTARGRLEPQHDPARGWAEERGPTSGADHRRCVGPPASAQPTMEHPGRGGSGMSPRCPRLQFNGRPIAPALIPSAQSGRVLAAMLAHAKA